MKIGLFIPCYIDQLYPHVGIATIQLLERLALDVEYPPQQTCCGQPMANIGCTKAAKPLALKFHKQFSDFDYVVCPSGSCVSMVRNHYEAHLMGVPGQRRLRENTLELSEFLIDVIGVTHARGSFPHKVAVHPSCHGLRELRLGESSELVRPPPAASPGSRGRDKGQADSKIVRLLQTLGEIEIVRAARADECCGFGGTFSVTEPAVSEMMGMDRIEQFEHVGAEVVTAADMSCLMHLQGLIHRHQKPLRVMHIAEILATAELRKEHSASSYGGQR